MNRFSATTQVVHQALPYEPEQRSAPESKRRSTSPLAQRLGDAGEKGKKLIQSNKRTVYTYVAGAAVILLVLALFSDGDFSFLLTAAGIVQLFGFAMLLARAVVTKSAAGVSLKSLQLYTVVFAARLSSITIHESYLPFDSSGDWVFPLVEGLSLAAVAATAFAVSKSLAPTYDKANDSFGSGMIRSELGAVLLAVPTFALALVFHPTLNDCFFTDFAWTWALYLETAAVLPQLIMFQRASKGGKPVEPWTSHFVALLGAARVLAAVFWVFSYHELGGASGYFVLVAQLVHVGVFADFLWLYLRALKDGTSLVLGGEGAGQFV